MNDWSTKIEVLSNALSSLSFRTADGDIAVNDGFRELERITGLVREKGNTVYVVGNGASA